MQSSPLTDPSPPSDTPATDPAILRRQAWTRLLVHATDRELADARAACPDLPPHHLLRGPEIGLALVRGRINGTGGPFNLGEMTMTRCTVRLAFQDAVGTLLGFAHLAGRRPDAAVSVALFDGLLQHPTWHDQIWAILLHPVAARIAQEEGQRAAETAATKVDFLTMVRGE